MDEAMRRLADAYADKYKAEHPELPELPEETVEKIRRIING